jgi:type I restriction enzyme S subunit
MKLRPIREVISLERRWLAIDPTETYEQIGVRSFGRGIFHKEPVSGASLGTKRVLRIEPGDLVLNNVFAWEGAVAVATDAERGMCGSHRFLTYTALTEEVDLTYLYYFFLSERGQRLLGSASPGSAGRNRTLAIERFEALEVPLPPGDVQRRIAAELKTVDEQVMRILDMIVATDVTPSSLLPQIVDRIIRSKAERSLRVGELVEIVSDLVRPGDDPSPASSFVGLQHVEKNTGRRLGEDGLDNQKGRKFRFAPGDIVYGYLRPYLNKAWLADRHGLCSVDQYVLRPTTDVPAEYVAYALRSSTMLKRAVDLTHNLQLPRLRSGLLLDIELPVPAPEALPAALEALNVATARERHVASLIERRTELISAVRPAALNAVFALAA